MRFFTKLLDLLFPPKCMFCRRVLPYGARGCCESCRESLPKRDEPKRGGWFSLCVSPLRYEGAVRQALIRFKFQDQPEYAAQLGAFLARCVREELEGQYDLITWVPVSDQRRKLRGYDQAMLLAAAAAVELGTVPAETLRKRKHIPAQSSLESAEERRTNVLGAYEAVAPERLAGKRILLIDDIITTGSTLEEASRTLLEAGAEAVVCAAVAHTVEKPKEEESL